MRALALLLPLIWFAALLVSGAETKALLSASQYGEIVAVPKEILDVLDQVANNLAAKHGSTWPHKSQLLHYPAGFYIMRKYSSEDCFLIIHDIDFFTLEYLGTFARIPHSCSAVTAMEVVVKEGRSSPRYLNFLKDRVRVFREAIKKADPHTRAIVSLLCGLQDKCLALAEKNAKYYSVQWTSLLMHDISLLIKYNTFLFQHGYPARNEDFSKLLSERKMYTDYLCDISAEDFKGDLMQQLPKMLLDSSALLGPFLLVLPDFLDANAKELPRIFLLAREQMSDHLSSCSSCRKSYRPSVLNHLRQRGSCRSAQLEKSIAPVMEECLNKMQDQKNFKKQAIQKKVLMLIVVYYDCLKSLNMPPEEVHLSLHYVLTLSARLLLADDLTSAENGLDFVVGCKTIIRPILDTYIEDLNNISDRFFDKRTALGPELADGIQALIDFAAVQLLLLEKMFRHKTSLEVSLKSPQIYAYLLGQISKKSLSVFQRLSPEECMAKARDICSREHAKIGILPRVAIPEHTPIVTNEMVPEINAVMPGLDETVRFIEGPQKKQKRRKKKAPEVCWEEVAVDESDESESLEAQILQITDMTEEESLLISSDDSYSVQDEDLTVDHLDVIERTPKATSQISHILPMLSLEDLELAERIDPRDIAYGYLLIGNHVYEKHLFPLIKELELIGIFLYIDFLKSLDKFESEIGLRYFRSKEVIVDIFAKVGIPNLTFFSNFMLFYKKRLRIAHPYMTQDRALRRSMARDHIATLSSAKHSIHGPGTKIVDDFKESFGGLLPITEVPTLIPFIHAETRPQSLAAPQDIDYELALLGIVELFMSDQRAQLSGGASRIRPKLRLEIAHVTPKMSTLEATISYVFKGTRYSDFLSLLLRNFKN